MNEQASEVDGRYRVPSFISLPCARGSVGSLLHMLLTALSRLRKQAPSTSTTSRGRSCFRARRKSCAPPSASSRSTTSTSRSVAHEVSFLHEWFLSNHSSYHAYSIISTHPKSNQINHMQGRILRDAESMGLLSSTAPAPTPAPASSSEQGAGEGGAAAATIVTMDVKKTKGVYDFLVRVGWVGRAVAKGERG